MAEKYRRDDDGNIIDPPVIQEYEREISSAAAQGDVSGVEEVQKRYDKARAELVRKAESASSDKGDDSDSGTSASGDSTSTETRATSSGRSSSGKGSDK